MRAEHFSGYRIFEYGVLLFLFNIACLKTAAGLTIGFTLSLLFKGIFSYMLNPVHLAICVSCIALIKSPLKLIIATAIILALLDIILYGLNPLGFGYIPTLFALSMKIPAAAYLSLVAWYIKKYILHKRNKGIDKT